MPKLSMMKAPPGHVPRGRTIRLYPTLEEKQWLRLIQDEARHAWNVLVAEYNAAVKAQYEAAERDGIIGPAPEKPKRDEGKEAWQGFYKTLSDRRTKAKKHSPELRMPIPKTDKETYSRLMQAWEESELGARSPSGIKRRMTANMYQALIQDFAAAMLPKKGMTRWRPPRFRKDSDAMPIRTGTGLCVKPSGEKKRNALVHLPGKGWMLGIAHRDLDLMHAGALVQGVAFREHTDGWYAAVRIYVPTPEPVGWIIDEAIGVDINMDMLAVLSDGTRWENPRNKIVDVAIPKEGPAPKIKRMPVTGFQDGKRIDNKWRESPERALTRRARHVGCLIDVIIRHLQQYRWVVIEKDAPSLDDLPKGIVHDAYVTAPRRLHTAIRNRLADRLATDDEGFSSQDCSGCGVRDKFAWSRKTGDGMHAKTCKCPHCGLELDRDVNAARNLVRRYWISKA
jgi:transposase